MFGSVPKPLWSKLHPPDDRNRIRLAMRCLLLEGYDRRVLVDDGIGDKLSPPSSSTSIASSGTDAGRPPSRRWA